jgi:hypothetical protein
MEIIHPVPDRAVISKMAIKYLRYCNTSLQIYKPAGTKTVKGNVENLFRCTSKYCLDVHLIVA